MNIEIEIRASKGLEYFLVYQVIGVSSDGGLRRLENYLNKHDAIDYKNFCYRNFRNLYRTVFVEELIVWVN